MSKVFLISTIPSNTVSAGPFSVTFSNVFASFLIKPISNTAPLKTFTLTGLFIPNFTALNNLADDVDFSIDGGATWNAVPVPASGVAGQPNVGCDLTINRIRINPKGTFVGNATAPNPSFQLKFRACVQ